MTPARLLALPLAAALALPAAPVFADPPPHAPAHGWRKKNDPNYVGYTGTAWPRDYGITAGRCQTDVILGVAGAAVGGAIGAQVGDGAGRTVAVLAGAALGAIVGASIGRSLDRTDEACIGHALELAAPGQTVRWTSATGVNYALTPVRSRGGDCREFKLTSAAGGKSATGTRIACRGPDAVWKLQA
jgi:surface antigen